MAVSGIELADNQFDVRKGRSTDNAVLALDRQFVSARDSRKWAVEHSERLRLLGSGVNSMAFSLLGRHSMPPPYTGIVSRGTSLVITIQRFPGASHHRAGHLGYFKTAFSLSQGPMSIVYTDDTLIVAEGATVTEVQERHARYRLRIHSRFGSLLGLQASPSVTISRHFYRLFFSRL